MMKELVEVIAKSLVDHPDEVIVTETQKENATVIELRVSSTDMGKVIGKQGRIAKAIRSLVKAAASKDEKKVVVEIVQCCNSGLPPARSISLGEAAAFLRVVYKERKRDGTVFKSWSDLIYPWSERRG